MTLDEMIIGINHCIGSDTTCRGCPYEGNLKCAAQLTQDLKDMIDDVRIADPRWVSVDDDLPPASEYGAEKYLIATQAKSGIRNINIAYFDGQFWHGTGSHAAVTHWRALPRLPEGGRAV